MASIVLGMASMLLIDHFTISECIFDHGQAPDAGLLRGVALGHHRRPPQRRRHQLGQSPGAPASRGRPPQRPRGFGDREEFPNQGGSASNISMHQNSAVIIMQYLSIGQAFK